MGKKLKIEEFIARSNEIHKNKYDYSLIKYKNGSTKDKFICSIHGIFEQKPVSHLKGQGCILCSGKYKKTKEEFSEIASKIHKNKYDYSLVEYKNNKTKVKIMCPEHGIFEQRVDMHLQGHGCDKCGGTNNISIKEFIQKASKIHKNKYDYSLVEFRNVSTKVKIICPIHGIFEQKPSEHLANRGCNKCANKNVTTEEFINKAKKIHGDLYDYSLVDYKNNKNKIKIICPIHGTFEQVPHYHLDGCGCSICNESIGERKIGKLLESYNIKYDKQKKFDNCRNKLLLPFDFYLKDYNCCIEFDGIQHYEPIDYFGGEEEFKKIQIRDKIKTNFCKNNNIKLYRIKYNQDIEDKLKTIMLKMNITYNF